MYFDLTGDDGKQIIHIETIGDNYEFGYMGGALKMHTTKAFVAEQRAQNAVNPDGVSTDGFVFDGDTHALDAMLQLPEMALLPTLSRALGVRGITGSAVPRVARPAQDRAPERRGARHQRREARHGAVAVDLLHRVPERGQRLLRHVRHGLQLLELGVRRLLLPRRLREARLLVPSGPVVLLLQHHGGHRAVRLLASASVARAAALVAAALARAPHRWQSTRARGHHQRQPMTMRIPAWSRSCKVRRSSAPRR